MGAARQVWDATKDGTKTTLTCHTTCPPYVVILASDRSEHPTRRSNDLWQTDLYVSASGGLGLGTNQLPNSRFSVSVSVQERTSSNVLRLVKPGFCA